jgi:hypothetical protein
MGSLPPDTDTIEALAAQVSDLRSDLTTVKARVEANGKIGPGSLAKQVADLAAAVAHLMKEEPPPKVQAPCWVGLSDGVYDEQLGELRDWVKHILVPEYAVKLAPCWWRHKFAVWELSTVHAEWTRIYGRKYPELAGALVWLERWLPGAVQRVTEHLRDCKGGHR